MLCVLLEVCAHVEVQGAQLECVRAQLERLDARASTLERHSIARRFATSSGPPTAARERALTLLDLSPDAIGKMVTFLDTDDELATALACRKLRDAIRGGDDAIARPRSLKTRVRGALAARLAGQAAVGRRVRCAVEHGPFRPRGRAG